MPDYLTSLQSNCRKSINYNSHRFFVLRSPSLTLVWISLFLILYLFPLTYTIPFATFYFTLNTLLHTEYLAVLLLSAYSVLGFLVIRVSPYRAHILISFSFQPSQNCLLFWFRKYKIRYFTVHQPVIVPQDVAHACLCSMWAGVCVSALAAKLCRYRQLHPSVCYTRGFYFNFVCILSCFDHWTSQNCLVVTSQA